MGQLIEFLPNLWLYEAVSAEISVRGAVVAGDRLAVVWDTLTHPRDVAALAAVLDDQPFHVVYSHADWDHCWGTSGFSRKPLSVIGHEDCRRRFADDVPQTLRDMQHAQPSLWHDVRLVPPDITFRTRMFLDLGGVTLELRHLPGHTRDCIVGWLPEWGVLLGGDAIETPLPVVNSQAQLDEWLAALKGWAGMPELGRSIPAHGATSGRKALEATIAYLEALNGAQEFVLPGRLTKFYRETHQKNLRVVAEKRDRND